MKSTIDIYLDEISKYPLLTQEEEIELSRIIQGDYPAHEKEKAIEDMVNSNLRLVVYYAKKLYYPCKSISLMDCIQEGNKALWKAAKGFNYDAHPVLFNTYATTGIERAIRRALGRNRPIHLPSSFLKAHYMIQGLEAKHGTDLTDEIIKKELNISDKRLKHILETIEKTTVVNDGNFSVHLEKLNESSYHCDDSDNLELKEYLGKSIATLPKKSQIAINKLFFQCESSREASRDLNISYQAINQAARRGMNRLRSQMIRDKVDFKGIPNRWAKIIDKKPVYKKRKKWEEIVEEFK